MSRSGNAFTTATTAPLPLLVAAAVWGGGYVWLALGYLTLFTFVMDQLGHLVADPQSPKSEFPAADQLSAALALAHFGLLGLAVYALSSDAFDPAHRAGLFLAFGLFFGQVSNSNAHELIHRSKKHLYLLGKLMFISLLFGHHTSAHPRIHHRFVATDKDPNSARRGESFYHFAPRAWAGSFRAGLREETKVMAATGRPLLRHPYVDYIGGAALFLLAAYLIGGPGGVLALILLAGYAQMQLLLSDYVQHYGLTRQRDARGRVEPVSPRHSWNAPHWFTSLMMLNSPRHSDHHAHPGKRYPELDLPAQSEAPMLPYGLPAMATLALFPRLWRRVMDKRLSRWSNPEEATATAGQ